MFISYNKSLSVPRIPFDLLFDHYQFNTSLEICKFSQLLPMKGSVVSVVFVPK